ncbi:hypothetical protein D3C86_1645230 [compost metagenome]
MNLLGHGDDGLGFSQRGVWQGKLLDVLGDKSAATGIQLVVELVVVERFNECGVGNGQRQPEKVFFARLFAAKPIAFAVHHTALGVDPEYRLVGDVGKYQLGP